MVILFVHINEHLHVKQLLLVYFFLSSVLTGVRLSFITTMNTIHLHVLLVIAIGKDVSILFCCKCEIYVNIFII